MPTDETSVATRPTISSSELTEPTGQPTSAAEPVAAAPPAASAAQEPPLTPAQPATPAGAAADEGGYQADRQPDFAAVEEAVAAWAAAWSEQRVDDYLAAYSRKFVPTGGLGRGEWAAQRRSRVLRPASIRVSLGAVSQTVAGADRVEVTFEQSYETDTYSDRVTKRLDLVWEDGGWKITAEKAD
jgi:hypothetical protein